MILMLLTFALIITSKELNTSISSKYKNIQCPSNNITSDQAYSDYKSTSPTGLLACYCSQQYKYYGYTALDKRFPDKS